MLRFKYYDEEHGVSLGGRSHIITIELSKLERIAAQKPVAEMTALEHWAVLFRYTPDKDRRELVNEIIDSEEGIAMAGQVLLSISKDEIERARLTSEYKFAVDLQSKMVDARREGEREGRREGKREGIREGRREGITAVARNFLRMNMSAEQIASGTGLTVEEIEGLRLTDQQ